MDELNLAMANFALATICDFDNRDIFIPLVVVPGHGLRAATCDSNYGNVELWEFKDLSQALEKLNERIDVLTDNKPAE